MRRSILAPHLAAIGLVLATTGSVAHAQSQNQNGQAQNQNGNPQNQNNPPRVSATPELDSALLFGAGVFGLGAASSVLRLIRHRRDPEQGQPRA
jgi:hypothetical protein